MVRGEGKSPVVTTCEGIRVGENALYSTGLGFFLFPRWKAGKQKSSIPHAFSSLICLPCTHITVLVLENKALSDLLQFPPSEHRAPCWKQLDCIGLPLALWSAARSGGNETETMNLSHTVPPFSPTFLQPELEIHCSEGWTMPERQHSNQTLLQCRQYMQTLPKHLTREPLRHFSEVDQTHSG